MKPINWKFIARIVYAYLLTASTIALSVFLVRAMRAIIDAFYFVIKQPDTFFTNKVLFLLLVLFSSGVAAVYFIVNAAVMIGAKAWGVWKDLLHPWRCNYGGRVCEVGKKGVEHPRFFCSRHFMERLETRVAVQYIKAKRRPAA